MSIAPYSHKCVSTMDLHLTFSSTTLASIFCFIIIVYLLGMPKKAKKPPQANGAWPIIGHLPLLGGTQQLPQRVLGDLADKHGPIFTMKLGVHQALVVSNAEIAKECYTTNDRVFASRPKSKAAELMGYNYALIGLSPYGDYWRKVRKILTLEVLSQRRVDMLKNIRRSELRVSMNAMYEAWVNNKDSTNMAKVELRGWFGNMILNVVVRIISGKRFSLDDAEGIRSLNAVRRFFELAGAFVVSDFIPYTDWLDLGGYNKTMKMAGKEIDDILSGWLKDHRRERESGKKFDGNQTVFMDVLISILEDASQDEFSGFDHDTIIKATCLGILIAASDSMAVTLTWAVSLLLNNPNALKKAQDELDEHVGRERVVEESDMNNLVYLDAIVKETLRLYPPGPLSIPHESMEDCVVGGYNIPKGTRLIVNLWKLHRDPKVFSHPYQFRPERFLTTQKDVDIKGNNFELLPFSSGRRMCPGIFFAMNSFPLTLASLIQQFVLLKPSDEPIDMSESTGLTTSKTTPLELLLAPRLSLNMYPLGA